jgi:hypothetical protein
MRNVKKHSKRRRQNSQSFNNQYNEKFFKNKNIIYNVNTPSIPYSADVSCWYWFGIDRLNIHFPNQPAHLLARIIHEELHSHDLSSKVAT